MKSLFDSYYDLTRVSDFGDDPETTNRMYEVCHLVRRVDTGGAILMGHLTVRKGHSRFEFTKSTSPSQVKMRVYCHYDVTVPSGRSFAGEKLLVRLGGDGIRGLEHLGDVIALANDVRLQHKIRSTGRFVRIAGDNQPQGVILVGRQGDFSQDRAWLIRTLGMRGQDVPLDSAGRCNSFDRQAAKVTRLTGSDAVQSVLVVHAPREG